MKTIVCRELNRIECTSKHEYNRYETEEGGIEKSIGSVPRMQVRVVSKGGDLFIANLFLCYGAGLTSR